MCTIGFMRRGQENVETIDRYSSGTYCNEFGDGEWKGRVLADFLLDALPEHELAGLESYADVGCGDGTVFAAFMKCLGSNGKTFQRAVGIDVSPLPDPLPRLPGFASLLRAEFGDTSDTYDLISLNDVAEHVVSPQLLLGSLAERARFVLLHIPLDDRWTVLLVNQFNYRLSKVGHISFWNASTAITAVTAAGLEPLSVAFTPGFRAPSGRVRASQRLALLPRDVLWRVSPGLLSRTLGGVSLAVLCRGKAPQHE